MSMAPNDYERGWMDAMNQTDEDLKNDDTFREFVDLEPGEYWLTSSGDGRGRAIVTNQHELIIEQFGGGWSCLGIGVPSSWKIEPRTLGDQDEWARRDEWTKKLAQESEKAEARERRLGTLTDELIAAAYPDESFPPVSEMQRLQRVADSLLRSYPMLLEA